MRLALVIAALVAAVGCGAGQTAPTAAPAVSLQISYWPEGRDSGDRPERSTLRCDPDGGTVPRPARACDRLAAMTRPFAPVPKDTVCTDQYGGPQEALVTGTYRGSRIWAILSLRNGCEITRAKRLSFLAPGLATGAAGS